MNCTKSNVSFQVCLCSNRPKIKERSLRFPELPDKFDLKSSEIQSLYQSDNCKTLTVEDDHVEGFPSNSFQCEESVLCNTRNIPGCSAPIRNDSQHKLDRDDIVYQNVDDKPPQYSPRAPSQSDSGMFYTLSNFL